ncbi:Quino protein alcohol dehydrogenase-like protein [Cladorrhinum sp. PSN259]|nr:Quino protein alcohol dehydrogenase-like protein [Cladorrhinum sp. PSN259]
MLYHPFFILREPAIPFGRDDDDGNDQIPDSQPPPSKFGSWLGWGADIYNNRWAGPDATVDVVNIDSLVPFCEKKYNPGVSASPLVFEGIAYYPTWSGLLVALNYRTCETVWRTNITKIILEYQPLDKITRTLVSTTARTTPVLDEESDVIYLGTLAHALLLAIDIKTGKLIDSLQLSDHPLAVLTQSPTFHDGRVYIGVSSVEEAAPEIIPDYQCCTFVGSMNAATLQHGRLRLLWTQSMVPPNTNISGSAIWGSQPSIDPIRRQVFIATGNTYQLPDEFEACQNQTANITVIKQGLTSDPCLPRNVFQESVLALDLESGRINWVKQLSPLDAWNVACVGGLLGTPPPGAELQCPDNPGPDADFGMAPAFVLGSEHTPDGLDIVVVGQKNGNLYALSAQAGMTLWAVSTGPDGLEGGLSWGMAVDDVAVYYTVINSLRENFTLPTSGNKTVISNSAFGAARLKDGRILWETPAPNNMSSFVTPAVVNDVVLSGVTGSFVPGSVFPKGPGAFTPIDKRTGKILEVRELDAYFHGVIAAVHEYVMFGTGYGGLETPQAGSFQVWRLKDEGLMEAEGEL